MLVKAATALYEEPKKLVGLGLARASEQRVGRRSRTVYAITPRPVLEFEHLLKIFFAENGTKADALTTLAATRRWAQSQAGESLAIGRQYLDEQGPFPGRLAQLNLTARFLTDFYAMVGEWAAWAAGVVETWPDDPREAQPDPTETEETVRRAAEAAGSRVPRE